MSWKDTFVTGALLIAIPGAIACSAGKPVGGSGVASANRPAGSTAVTAPKAAAMAAPEMTAAGSAPESAITAETPATTAPQAPAVNSAGAAGVAALDHPAVTATESPAVTPSEPGVTATEIKIGQVVPYSGPAAPYGIIGKVQAAYFRMINDAGGVNGRKLRFISVDDAYSPIKSVEQTRKLVKDEGVAFMFSSVGGAPNRAVQSYLNQQGVPQLFVANGRDGWADPANHPWTIGWQPSYRIEARVYARYLLAHKAKAKICVLYQNDDFGKDYLDGLQDGLGAKYAKMVIKKASYEVTDPTIESQIDALRISGCDTLIAATIPKFGAQAIRKVFDIGWKPLFFMANVSASIPVTIRPAGMEKAIGLITSMYLKDPQDPANQRDPAIAEWRKFMNEYFPDGDQNDSNSIYGYAVAQTLIQVLEQCGNDLSRRNVMKQAASLQHFKPTVLIKGIEINTDATDYRPITQLQLVRFTGKTFERLGNIIAGE